MTKLQYRGVSYDNAKHQPPASTPVEHAYRGLRYASSLRHEPAATNLNHEFHYRGHVYHHRDGAASA